MSVYEDKDLQKHCELRNEHELTSDNLLIKFISTYYPNTYDVYRTTYQWERYDYKIENTSKSTSTKVEFKQRDFSIEDYNQYKTEGFALSISKLNNCDVILYYINTTNELLHIRTDKVKQLLEEKKLKVVERNVYRYQYAKNKGKHIEKLVLIPIQYWKVYNL